MLRRAQIRQQSSHLIEGPPAHGLVIPTAAQIVADALLMIPEQPMQGQDVGVRDEGHGMIGLVDGLAIRGDLDEEAPGDLEVGTEKVVEGEHVLLLAELHVVGDVLEDLGHEHEAALDGNRDGLVDDAHLLGRDDGRIDEAQKDDGAHGADVVLGTLGEALAQHLVEAVAHRAQLRWKSGSG